MAGKRKQIQALVTSMLGSKKEPSFTVLTSEKIDMIKALNFYAVHYRFEHSKAFAVKWAKDNMPEIYPALKDQKDWRFGSYGFVLRMADRGFVLTTDHLNKIKSELRLIASHREERVYKPKVQKKTEHVNKALETFDLAIDTIMNGGKPTPTYGVDATDNREVIRAAEKMESDLIENAEYYRRSTARDLRAFIRQTKNLLSDTVKKMSIVPSVKSKQVQKPKKKNPAMVAKGLKHSLSDGNLKGLPAERLMGASKALVYHANFKHLLYLVSSSPDGFSASGSTLKNIDPEKSFFKKVRNPKLMEEALETNSLAGMRDWIKELSTTQFVPKGRFNETTIILKIG